MAQIKIPEIRPSGTIEGKVDALYDAYFVMRKFMTYYLSGNLDEENVVRAQEAVIANVLAGTIKADQIDVTEGKIQAAQIENLVVGGNVTMGPNATISWSKVTGAPSIPTTADITTIAANYIATPNLYTNIAKVANNLSLGGGYKTSSSISFDGIGSIEAYNDNLYISAMTGVVFIVVTSFGSQVYGLENSGYVKQQWVIDNFVAK